MLLCLWAYDFFVVVNFNGNMFTEFFIVKFVLQKKIKKENVNVVSHNERHQIDAQNHLGDILLDLMRIAMDGDQQEFDNEKLGEHVSDEIYHNKKS